jgi:hypothetical protein
LVTTMIKVSICRASNISTRILSIIQIPLEQIDNRKSYAEQVSTNYYVRDEAVQWIIVILSLSTKLYPKLTLGRVDFAIALIILSAMIAAVTSIHAYYQFDEYRRLSQNMADDSAELQEDIHFLLLRHAASEQGSRSMRIRSTTGTSGSRRSCSVTRNAKRATASDPIGTVGPGNRNGGRRPPFRQRRPCLPQASLYSCDLNVRCRVAAGASASLRMLAQVCL